MTVEKRSNVVSSMLIESATVADIIAGGRNMRMKGRAYLPQFAMESNEAYDARLASTWLFNGVKKARDDIAGKIFERPVVLAEDYGDLNTWAGNIDNEGRDLSNFAADLFKDGLQRGISFIFVDAPRREGGETRGEVQRLNLRPFMSLVPLDKVLGWSWRNIDNVPTITQFRIHEVVEEPGRSDFADDTIEQIRVLTLIDSSVVVSLYRREKGKGQFLKVDEYPTTMTQIQVVPFYTGRTGFMAAESPLSEIAELNLAHWRVQSDKANCLHKSLSPLLLIKGIPDIKDAVSSAEYAFASTSEHADIKWAEISGSGIAEGREELKSLEQQMQWQGLQLQMSRVAASTATGDAIDEGKSTSRIRMWADDLKDSLEIALGMMADMGGLQVSPEVVVHKDFSVLSHLTMADVRDLYTSGAISRETYIREAIRRGVLDESVNPEDEKEMIEQEAVEVDGDTGL